MKHSKVYEKLCEQAEIYYKKHKSTINKEWHDNDKKIILEKMPLLQNVSIWCRDGRFCRKATHCEDIPCDYKDSPGDVFVGCAECQNFQVTTLSDT